LRHFGRRRRGCRCGGPPHDSVSPCSRGGPFTHPAGI